MPRARQPDAVRAPAVEELLDRLARPEAWGAREEPEVRQTHSSVVFLVGERAYKVKKPLRLWGLMDYGTAERRRHFCEEEVRLNRRLAPGFYLGVRPIVRRGRGLFLAEAGTREPACAHAVEMRRFPAGASLAERLAAGTLDAEALRRVAGVVARFHAAHGLPPAEAALARPAAFARVLAQNFRATGAAVPWLFPEGLHRALRRRLARRLRDARRLLRARLARGLAVDGHGDLRLEHTLLLGAEEVAIVDCVEFTPRLRHLDPLSDAAFLSMELRLAGRGDLALAFEEAYRRASGTPPGEARALLPLFLAYRAHVRAKVDAQRAVEPEVPAEARREAEAGARRHLVLAWSLARAGSPALVLVRGPSGTGKSVLARAIAPWLGAEVVSSDLVRKALLGIGPTERPRGAAQEAAYSKEVSRRVYATLLARGREALLAGRTALLDATWLLAPARREARDLAEALHASFAIVDLECPAEIVRERLARRAAEGSDPSDADWPVYLAQVGEAEPLAGEELAARVPGAADESPESIALRLAVRLEEPAPGA